MVTINLKGREIPLLFTSFEMKMVQEEIAPNEKLLSLLSGVDPDNPDSETMKAGSAEHLNIVAKTIRIMGNAGLEETGEEPDLTNKKVLRSLRPADLVKAVAACVDAFNDGFKSEIPEGQDEGPVDVVLEEMNKKKEKED